MIHNTSVVSSRYGLLFLFLLCFCMNAHAEKTILRLGVLAFGSVHWVLTSLKNSDLLKTESFQLHIQTLANPQAGKIALQAGAVDMIVADWVWVSKQRAAGFDFSFYPYSNTSGALLVPADSPIHSITDLKQVRLGIAGGELDKNWLLLQALGRQCNIDLDKQVQKVYAAPPLLNQQLLQNRVDAILTYWHYAARLQAQGYRQILDGQEIQHALGIQTQTPMLGYVFHRAWAKKHRKIIRRFFQAINAAGNELCRSDQAWQAIYPLLQTAQDEIRQRLRQGYCRGRIMHWENAQRQAAEQIYQLLRQFSRQRLTGKAENISPGTFWILE